MFHAGEGYLFSHSVTEQEVHKIWVETPLETCVATERDNEIVGIYFIKPSRPGPGRETCNCGYIVRENARGRGVASSMCENSQQAALALGFRAMQYNLVASTSKWATSLWEKLGFEVIGTLPNAFKNSAGGADAIVLYKVLNC